jgi:heat shock protein HslJ
MPCGRGVWLLFLGAASALQFVLYDSAGAADQEFPYGREMMLDANPMRGSKKVPVLEIDSDGNAAIDMWCNSVTAQFVVAADTLTILPGAKTARACSPDRERGDDELLSALAEVTNWRRSGDALELVGPKRLRFRLFTN